MSIHDILVEPLIAHGEVDRSEAEHRIAWPLDRVELPVYAAARRARELSGGQRQGHRGGELVEVGDAEQVTAEPRDPYTRLLLSALVPDPDRQAARRAARLGLSPGDGGLRS